jgi:hypothetical protein
MAWAMRSPSQAVVVGVDRNAAMETHGVLRQGGVERAIGRERQGGGVGHVGVQHTGLAGDAVNGGVDEHGRGFDLVATGELLAVGVDQHDVVGLDFVPHQAAGIQQEMIGVAGQRHAEMVADAFAESVRRGGTQGQREVSAQGGDVFGVEERIGKVRIFIHEATQRGIPG